MTIANHTTRQAFIAQLKEGAHNNRAIANHLKEVEAMTDEEWPAHRASLIEMGKAFAASGTAARMVREIKRSRR